jgi:hypothetical protein
MITTVSNKVIMMASSLFILNLTKKATTGWSNMARMVAKRSGTRMLRVIYNIENRTYKPTTNKAALTKNGRFKGLAIMA